MRDVQTQERAALIAGDLVCLVDSLLSLPPDEWPRLRRGLTRAQQSRTAEVCRHLEILLARERQRPV